MDPLMAAIKKSLGSGGRSSREFQYDADSRMSLESAGSPTLTASRVESKAPQSEPVQLDEIDLSPPKGTSPEEIDALLNQEPVELEEMDISETNEDRAKTINRIIDGLQRGGYQITEGGKPGTEMLLNPKFGSLNKDKELAQKIYRVSIGNQQGEPKSWMRMSDEDISDEAIMGAIQQYLNAMARMESKP